MKLSLHFGIENASWPALVLDDAGFIVQASTGAVNVFGPSVSNPCAFVETVWALENAIQGQLYLTQLARSIGVNRTIKVRGRGGRILDFQCLAANSQADGRKYFLLQFFPPPPPSSPPPAPAPAPASPSEERNPNSTAGGLTPRAPAPGRGIDVSAADAGLAHKQKLDCALQLARTVASDFNNALTSILGHASLLLSRCATDHPWRGSLVEVEKSAERAAEIANDLAAFSRQEKDPDTQAAGNLNEVLRRTIEIFQTPTNVGVRWESALEPRLYAVFFDEAKLQQALVKVLENAVQALPDGAGMIRSRSWNLDVEEVLQDETVMLKRGSYVCVEIQDTGAGIPLGVLGRVFEPFFTTKPAPHRGLGLAWVYGIVTNHGGSVAVSSPPEQGAAVRLYLPAIQKYVRDHDVRLEDLGGTETILMVDDEDLLLTMGQMVLSAYGYRVLTANNGRAALELFAADPAGIDLVITDLVMPKMHGRELMDELHRISPSARVLCSSGYARAHGTPDELYLQKPFTSQELLRRVKQALNQLPNLG